jgi:hypothetical protein
MFNHEYYYICNVWLVSNKNSSLGAYKVQKITTEYEKKSMCLYISDDEFQTRNWSYIENIILQVKTLCKKIVKNISSNPMHRLYNN